MEEQTKHDSSTEASSARSAEALRELRDRGHAALERHRKQMRELEERLEGQLASLSEAVAEQVADQAKVTIDEEEHAKELAELRRKLNEAETEWRADRERLDGDVKARQLQLDEREATWQKEREALVSERDRLTDALLKVEEQFRAGLESSKSQFEPTELEHKFNLAMEDVERLRQRVSELEEELADRPNVTRSELADMRSQREALLERLEVLEKQASAQGDKSIERQQADLQRRFELAVEDVRQLKTEKAELEEKLAETKRAKIGSVAGESDWESQKRRLLASLEQEGNPADPGRQKEHATISNTIRITDSVVAAKDRELAELKEQLAAAGRPTAVDEYREYELPLDDEIVKQHRERLAQMEKMLEETLRAAELELSIERAKIAREKAQLAQQHLELEQLRDSFEAAGGTETTASGAKPRRRWLAKLGLGESEDHGADV